MAQRLGEALHKKGDDGAQRAKYWLDATTRTRSSWTNEDDIVASRLEFNWPHGKKTQFSFDIGGILFGDPFHNHQFVAEVKNHNTVGNLGSHFDDFLAKCYFVAKNEGKLANQFMFMTWNPFRAENWSKHTSKESIIKGCVKNKERLLGAADKSDSEAASLLDADTLEFLQDTLWLVVLSDKQESLLISDEDRALINHNRTIEGLI